MVKIEKVRINGIRGFRNIVLDGEISPREIQINCKNFFVLGENGTGKSSLYDALEWCITGECEEANNRRCKCNDFLKNKSAEYSPNLITEIEFEDNHKLSRSLDGKTSSCKPQVLPVENCIKHDNSDSSFIDVNRINKFVLEAPANLWKAFSDLLNFEELRDFDKKLVTLMKEVTKKHDELKLKYEEKLNYHNSLIKDVTEIKTRLKSELGESWGDKIKELLERKSDLKNYDVLKDKLVIFYDLNDKFGKNKKELFDLEEQKKQIKSTIDTLKLNIINSAEEYFNKTEKIEECPICHNKNIEVNKIKQELTELKKQNESLLKINSGFSEKSSVIKTQKEEIRLLLNVIKQKFQELNLLNYIKSEESKQIELIINSKENLSTIIKENSNANIILIEQFKKKSDDIIISEKELFSYKTKYELYNEVLTDIEEYQKTFSITYKNKIQSELDNLSRDTVFKVYNEINKSEHDQHIEDLKIVVSDLDATNPTIDFTIKVNGVYVDAISSLSTGHLKCLGFALLIAKFKIKNTKIKALFVDDPIYAIDHEHRYNLIQYFHQLSNEGIQLIIFSSDRLFFEILCNSFGNSSYIAFESNWHPIEGVNYLQKDAGFISKAKEQLARKDIRASALYTRLSLEATLFKIAKKLKLKIPYGVSIGMKQLVKDYDIETIFKAQFSGKTEEIEEVFTQLKQPKCSKILLGTFGLDQELHHVHEARDSYTIAETKEIVSLVENFINVTESMITEQEDN